MSGWLHTTRFTRRKLPHGEVLDGRYFVTVRCADSLPRHAVDRLREIHDSLLTITPNSDQFAALQREYFLSMEKHLDALHGSCVLARNTAAQIVATELAALREWGIDVPHYSIMPNHWHAMLVPRDRSRSLSEVLRRVKGRSARAINALAGKSGRLWQPEWFDRWMRNEAEFEKCVRYIQNNPVKAGLVASAGKHPWTR